MEITSVFSRRTTSDPILSTSVYNLVMGLTLCWGFALNWWLLATIPGVLIAEINPFLFLMGFIGSCGYGVYLFRHSNSAIKSFIGYNFVVIPFGLMMDVIVCSYNPGAVADAIGFTGLVTFCMLCLGSLFPIVFQVISTALASILGLAISVGIFEYYVFGIHHGIIDWIILLVFCCYIAVDWGRANQIPKTLNNAVDSAASLYMDIIYFFIILLMMIGEKNK